MNDLKTRLINLGIYFPEMRTRKRERVELTKRFVFRSSLTCNREKDKMVVEGYAYKWGDRGFADGSKEKIEKGAFSFDKDLMLYQNHKPDKILGRIGKNLDIKQDDTGIKFKAVLPDTTDGRDAYELVSGGILDGMSVGMEINDYQYDSDNTRVIKGARLNEVSLTQTPVYKKTEVTAL